MTREHEYPPPPNASHEEMQPFPYGSQQQMPPSENPQHPPAAAANMQEDTRAMQGYGQANPYGPTYGLSDPSTPQQLAQRGLAVGPSQESSETRSKASRACDECRRKKTKCDADSEQPGVQCSACRRTNQNCGFTRPPQKRGPNKGYIKDLEHRLRGVESQLGSNAPSMQYSQVPPGIFGAFPVTVDHGAKKRNYDMIGSVPTFDETPTQLQTDHSQQPNTYEAHSLNRDQDSRIDQDPQESASPSQKMHIGIARNASNLEVYYKAIHPYHPVLAHDKRRQQRLLDGSECNVVAAFFDALECASFSCTSTDITPLAAATNGLDALRLMDPNARTVSGNYAYIQALILMIIAKENSGPSHAGDTVWYNEAVRVGILLQLHKPNYVIMQDHFGETIAALGRRAWLVLATLDRWNAASKNGMMLLARGSVQLVDSDEGLLGVPAYQLTRLSILLGQISEGFLYHNVEFLTRELLSEIMYAILDAYRINMKGLFATMPQLELAYLHTKLFADRLMEVYVSHSSRIVEGAFRIVTILRQKPGPHPLTHHWAGLAAVTLSKCLSVGMEDHSADEITGALHGLREGLQSGQVRDCQGRKTIWDQTIASFITKKLDPAQRLEGLADAAVGNTQGNIGQQGQDLGTKGTRTGRMDWSASTKQGYLNLFD